MIKLNKDFLVGAAVGFAAGFLAKSVGQNNPAMKSLAKSTIKAGLVGMENLRVQFSRMAEAVSDIIAEVKSEKKTEEVASVVSIVTEPTSSDDPTNSPLNH